MGGSVANPKGQGYPYPERCRLVQPGLTHPGLKLEEVTLAEAFSEGGYRTGFVGNWHLGPTSPEQHGFDFGWHVTEHGHPAFDGETFMTVTKTEAALDFIDACSISTNRRRRVRIDLPPSDSMKLISIPFRALLVVLSILALPPTGRAAETLADSP